MTIFTWFVCIVVANQRPFLRIENKTNKEKNMKADDRRLFLHHGGLFWNYRWACTDFLNKYFDNEEWRCYDYWYLYIRFDPYWANTESLYYDGCTAKSFTFLGVTFGKSYDYESKSVANWMKEDDSKI